ncbi:MAG: MarR family transcriptional regulator [Acidimicrobiia bacterium]|nr:MarR family transcriptional regulator [Acidimicrobiia bacterium]
MPGSADTADTADSTDTVMPVERSLERLFRLTVNRAAHHRQTEAIGVDVTRAGFAILRTLADDGDLPMGRLARRCSMDPAAANRQVRALVDAGLVERVTDPDDARLAVARLTPAGRRTHDRIVALRTEQMTDVLADWSDHDRAELVRLVDRLVADLRATPLRTDQSPTPPTPTPRTPTTGSQP